MTEASLPRLCLLFGSAWPDANHRHLGVIDLMLDESQSGNSTTVRRRIYLVNE
jgi:hypothetical protein